MYAKALAILLLLSGLIAGLWKFADYCGDAREAEVRLEVAQSEGGRQKEIIRLQQLLSEQRLKAENEIIADRPKHMARIRELDNSPVDYRIPCNILRVHAETGLYSGEVGPCEVRDANVQ